MRHSGAGVNDSKLRGLDSYLKKTLVTHREAEDTGLRLSLNNHDGNNN